MRLSNDLYGWLRRSFSLVALTGALLMGGCTDDEVLNNEPNGHGEKFTFTAVAPTGTLSRALWNAEPANGKLGFNWEDTDKKIDLWQATETTVKAADMSVNADDRSTVTITAESIDKEKDVFAFFPSGKVMINEGTLTLPCLLLQPELTQKGATTDHLRDYMYLVGGLKPEDLTEENPTMQLGLLCTVLRFNVQNGTDEQVRVTKVEMLATEEGKGVNMLYALLAYAAPSDSITVNVQDADDETKGHLLAAGGALSVYAHCFSTDVNDGQFQFRVTVTDADGGNPRVLYTKEEFSVAGITTTKSNDASQKIFKEGHYYTFNLDISKTGDGERFNTIYTWNAGTVASESLKGEGTEESPYLIASAQDLQCLINNYDQYYSKNLKLTTDIIIESDGENPWPSIGPNNPNGTRFKGTFDGNNHTISGAMVVDGSVKKNGSEYFGFFRMIGENGLVKDLNIKADVTGRQVDGPGTFSYLSGTGSVAGINEGTIENCTASGTVKGGDIGQVASSHTGGIVGYNVGTVMDCSNSGDVKGGNDTSNRSGSNTGGIVGFNEINSTVVNCTNSGSVIGGKTNQFNSNTGGIVGKNYSSSSIVKKCTNSGKVTAGTTNSSSGGKVYTGGLVGENNGKVCICCKDDSNYKVSGKLRPIGNEVAQTQVEDCSGTHE